MLCILFAWLLRLCVYVCVCVDSVSFLYCRGWWTGWLNLCLSSSISSTNFLTLFCSYSCPIAGHLFAFFSSLDVDAAVAVVVALNRWFNGLNDDFIFFFFIVYYFCYLNVVGISLANECLSVDTRMSFDEQFSCSMNRTRFTMLQIIKCWYPVW